MSVFCIGDLHGCYDEFQSLLEKIDFDDHRDEVYLTGDIIGRGPKPLETLKFIIQYQNSFHCVLGNHDLNFLAVTQGQRQARPKDNLEPLLHSDDLDEFIHFFCQLPLIKFCKDKRFAICHAGIHPLWDLSLAKKLSKEITTLLSDNLRRTLLLRNMYRDYPAAFNPEYKGMVRWRYIINVFTRMRLINKNLELDYGHSSSSIEEAASEGLEPWFNFLPPLVRHKKNYRLVFGHWAALNGKCQRDDVIALDTGCVWGGKLSAWNADLSKIESVDSIGHLTPNSPH